MSELKLVSPLLDGFAMGDPISEHDGVRCCPAMKENSDDKYIVKVISVPASQKQLDALLLTGAYKDAGAAAEYFKTLAEDMVKEARLLLQLSKLEGFLPYEGWQIVPMEGSDLGYDVYLLGSYKRSLEKFLRRNAMTHLGAVNLGIDLCAALSLCRRAGVIYTDLKPANIFISGQREYRIGDLGFSKLSAMKYTSLPRQYVSRYTPPELHDPFATLNPTVDIYAVGMILYQIYNNGELPFSTKAPLRILPAPLNADYEMAEIIQKACHPNPRERYQTPTQMGQALASYLQRNRVNDTPIVPPSVDTIHSDAPVEETPAAAQEVPAEASEAADVQVPEELEFMDTLVSDDTAPGAQEGDDLVSAQTSDEVDLILAQADELISHEPDIIPDAEEPEEEPTLPEEPQLEPAQEDLAADESGELEIPLPEINAEEPAETEGDLEIPAISPEDRIEITEAVDDDLDFGLPTEDPAPAIADEEDPAFNDFDFFENTKTPKKKRGWIGIVILVLILALLGGGAYYYYTNFYHLPIDHLEIVGFEDTITVKLTTDADEALLTVVCTDTYGNKQEQPVVNGQVAFENLNPNTMYKIVVETDDFHKLSGSLSGSYTTPEVTNIIAFTAKGGTEDGSVILNFTVDGPETQDWTVEYTAAGEDINRISFTGHMVTITDLTVGKRYTFTLLPPADLYLSGITSMEYLASKIVVAENLSILPGADGVMTAQWSVPEDVTAESWTVRCYSENGYDETVTVTETSAQFEGISTDAAYTVEVTAAGMSQNARAFITANPATVTDVQITHTADTGLTVTWKSDVTPTGGWLMMYSVDGSDTTEMAQCSGTTAVIRHVIPNASYRFQIMAADGSTVFGGAAEFAGVEPTAFNKHGLSATYIQSSLCRSPGKDNWTYKDVDDNDYTTSFTAGEAASLVLYTYNKFYLNTTETAVMFVIRNEEGQVIPTFTRVITKPWRDLWPGTGKYCYLDIPVMPTVDGKYTIELYFDGGRVLTKNFSIITSNG